MKANMNKIILAAVGACAILVSQLPTGAQAQQVPGRSTTAAPIFQPAAVASASQKGEWVLTPDQDMVRVPLNKVVSVRLTGTVANVIVANPDIADVILPEDGERSHVYVLARQVGSTTIVFEDANGKILCRSHSLRTVIGAFRHLNLAHRIPLSSERHSIPNLENTQNDTKKPHC